MKPIGLATSSRLCAAGEVTCVRKRYKWFCERVVVRSAEEGRLTDDVLIEAAQDVFKNLGRREPDTERTAALDKAHSLLRRPDIQKQLESVYETRGFTIIDAVAKHVEHIRGVPMAATDKDGKPIFDGDGKPIVVRAKPSWPALKAYFDMVLPKPAKQTDARVVTVHASASPEARESLPAMEARVLSVAPEDAS